MITMPISLLSRGPADTQALAGGIAQLVGGGDLVLLSGELGTGKTAFSQGFGAALEVKQRITSPTFILVQSYEGRIPMHHVDAYRLENIEEAVDLGLPELLDGDGVTVIEWGERIRSTLPADLLDIRIEYGERPNDRRFELTVVGRSWMQRSAALQALTEKIPETELPPESRANSLETDPC